MTTSKMPIGQIKVKATATCTICSCKTKRNISEFVYENTPEATEVAKSIVIKKANAEYTCNVCKSILKSI